jgi:hypothetical protein
MATSAARAAHRWGSSRTALFGTMGDVQFNGGVGIMDALLIGPNGALYESGLFDQDRRGQLSATLRCGTASSISRWAAASIASGDAMVIDPLTGNL